jgi:hypothetical protein
VLDPFLHFGVATTTAAKQGQKIRICFQQPEGKFERIIYEKNIEQLMQDWNLSYIFA